MSTQLESNLQDILNQKNTYIVPENIKSGVTVFGVTGTYSGSGGGVIIDIGDTLELVDGTELTLATGYYKINGLSVNNTVDTVFTDSLIYIHSDSTYDKLVSIIDGPSKSSGNPVTISKIYGYANGEWTIVENKYIQYSTTDLTPGTSPLPTGSFYFVYE